MGLCRYLSVEKGVRTRMCIYSMKNIIKKPNPKPIEVNKTLPIDKNGLCRMNKCIILSISTPPNIETSILSFLGDIFYV